MNKVWCVAWRVVGGSDIIWCATARGVRPSTDAASDATACGWVVTLRIGSARRAPTCFHCKRRGGVTR